MNEKKMSRLACLVTALFPALWGIFSLLNNFADFQGTAQHAVQPLISMADTYHQPAQQWRAITAVWAPYAGLAVITIAESLAGIFSLVGIIIMLCHFGRSAEKFSIGRAWVIAGTCCAIMVWGIGFMVIAGDWFMAWEASHDPLSTQLGAMIYALPCMLTLIIQIITRETTG
ncbi:DUF2165 family protein [Enterobacteriaceae bacterium LUAb1]